MTKCKWTDRCKYCLDKEREEMPISTPQEQKVQETREGEWISPETPLESPKEWEEKITAWNFRYRHDEDNLNGLFFIVANLLLDKEFELHEKHEESLAQKTEEVRKEIILLIAKECNIARSENQTTSRLISLSCRISSLLKSLK